MKPITVSELNNFIKTRMDRDEFLSSVCVRGEISNYKLYPSGHHYFSLKDPSGALKCVMFAGSAKSLKFRPENGKQVLAMGRVTVYPRDGVYQLYVEAMAPEGEGDLNARFEKLKKKLEAEGLFSEAHKKPLPAFPGKIALITSPVGAAVRDMIRILSARWPMTEVLVVGVRVQGSEAPGEIARAIDYVNQNKLADLIITGRGGGSLEDLWAFNEEIVARAIFNSAIPVISAVGHEPDVTISDYVADARASTPSNAAEISVPDRAKMRELLSSYSSRLNPKSFIDSLRQDYDSCRDRMISSLEKLLLKDRQQLAFLSASLDAMSPFKVLSRGYAIASKEGHAVTERNQLSSGDQFLLTLSDGELNCEVL